MSLLGPSQVTGETVRLKRTNPLHLDSAGRSRPVDGTKPKNDFQNMLFTAINGANNITQKSLSLERQAIVDPQSVNAHDIMIALGESNMALSLTKAVVDRVLRAYQDIINIR
jgi:flagellar hook-basal body complex protein FliE